MIYPNQLVLEVTNLCNLKCVDCHFHGERAEQGRAQGVMSRDIWEKVINEVAAWPVNVTMATHGAGEPLLHPNLEEILLRASKTPNISVGFMSNAMLLDQKWSEKLVGIPVDWVSFSVDGVNPITHDLFRKEANLEQIENNIYQLIDEKQRKNSDKPTIAFNMVGYPAILEQIDEYVKKWLPHAREVTIATHRPVGDRGLLVQSSIFKDINFQPCSLLYEQMVIGFDGQVGLCCEDIHMDVPLGDVTSSSLLDIYNKSEEIQKHRLAHQREKSEKGHLMDLPLCKNCDVWASSIVLNEEILHVGDMQVNKKVHPAYIRYSTV